jgi:hypothetical protein
MLASGRTAMSKQNACIVHETKPGGGERRLDGPFGERRLDGPFASKERADAAAERWREQGIDAHVVALPRL